MSRPKRLSGDEIISIFASFGFVIHSQRGSHVKLRACHGCRTTTDAYRSSHKELDSGTIRAIFRQASQYIPEDQLRPLFFA